MINEKILTFSNVLKATAVFFGLVAFFLMFANQLYFNVFTEKAFYCLYLKQKQELTNVTVGSTMKFGIYEQDNGKTNGKEEIEWLVLAAENNNALKISKYALDRKQYNTSYTSVTWETCTLRQCLQQLRRCSSRFVDRTLI
ncbi:MAG: hypothetical protein IJS67_03445 [Clostridia bacterium]|nr:hypothetical protein [Clostridia bacterium]